MAFSHQIIHVPVRVRIIFVILSLGPTSAPNPRQILWKIDRLIPMLTKWVGLPAWSSTFIVPKRLQKIREGIGLFVAKVYSDRS